MSKWQWPATMTGWFGRWKKLSLAPKYLVATLLGGGLLALIYLLYSLYFLGQVYPHVMIGNQRFAGLTAAEARTKLTTLVATSPAAAKLLYQDRSTAINQSDVDWKIDVDQTTNLIYAVGRSGSFWPRLWVELKAPFAVTQISPVVSYDSDGLESQLTVFTETIDQPAVDASAKFVGDKLTFSSEKVGKRINRAEVQQKITSAWGHFQPVELTLELAFEAPKVVMGSEDEIRLQVDKLSESAVTLNWPGSQKVLTKNDIHQLIGFAGSPTKNDQGQQTLQASFTLNQAKTFVTNLASSINQPAKEPKLIIKDGALAIAQASQSGKVVDVETTATNIVTALTSDPASPTAELVLKAQDPIIREDNLAALGIKERIGQGVTSFVGSPANRKANIANGVSLLQSALVKPGDEFSTVNTLGRVDDTTGFLPELVIKENKTTPEFGGGLCQVSTTLFRSVMNAGLKVTARQNHSYRVGYYEPPVGLDATIYLPKPDFKFLNDTGSYILVQGRIEGSKVIFELWGTHDGRSSTISDPQILSTTPSGDPIYTDTDTLPKGETKQTEKAHDGAVTTATYTVFRNGQVINKQVFKSVYKPWPAQFLVGTHVDPNAPPPDQPPA